MAVAVAEAQQGLSSANVTSLATGTFATSPNVGDAVVVFVTTGTKVTHTAPTDSAGHTASQIGSEQSSSASGAAGGLSFWIFENLTTGTGLGSYKVTAHWPSASGTVIAVRVTGQLTPTSYNGDIVQSSLTAQTSSTNPSVGPTTVAPAANSIFFGGLCSADAGNAAYTDGTNVAWTHVTNETQTNNTTDDCLFAEHFIETGGSTTKQTAQWTAASTHWFASVFSLAPATGNVTVALTGQSVTASKGTLTPEFDFTATGQGATASAGTVVPGIGVTPTGQGVTATTGALTASATLALTGESSTATTGTLGPEIDLTLSGKSVTASEGTLTVGSDVTVTLTGQGATASTGLLAPEIDLALTGQSATASEGTLTPSQSTDVTLTLTGVSATASIGTLDVQGASTTAGAGGYWQVRVYRDWRSGSTRHRKDWIAAPLESLDVQSDQPIEAVTEPPSPAVRAQWDAHVAARRALYAPTPPVEPAPASADTAEVVVSFADPALEEEDEWLLGLRDLP